MPQFSQSGFAVRFVAIKSLIVLLAIGSSVFAQVQATNIDVQVGIGGTSKLGHWVPVHFIVPAGTPGSKATRYRITVLDGDDTPSSIVGPLVKTQNGFQGVMQFGRTYGELRFELLDDDENLLVKRETQILESGNQFSELLPSTARMLACIEKPVATDDDQAITIASSLASSFPGGTKDSDRVVTVGSFDDLPRSGIGYDSCESLILLANDQSWLGGASERTLDAIESWVRNGGHFLIVAGADNGALFQTDGLLERFAPGKVVGSMELDSSRRLEEFCSSKEPFLSRGQSFPVLKIEEANGHIALGQGDVPLVVRRPVGLGEVTFMAFDPTSDQFRQWKAGGRLMQSLMKLRIGDESTQPTNDARSSSGTAVRHSGYEDLVGQMKVPLERFTQLRFIPFVLIAALIALYILCIGVGDWFLVGRFFKKHELTWITFPLLAAGFCGIAWYAAKASRPATIQLNQVELVDIDSLSGHVRASVWANLYSPRGRNVDLDLGVRDETEGFGLQLGSSRLSWLGLPGDGLGGMLNRANPGLYRSGYVQEMSWANSNSSDINAQMLGVELQVSSTRPLFGQWNGKFKNRVESRLRRTDRLEGTFANPFDVPLRDCRLFYDDLVYVIEKSLPADGIIDISSDTRERTIKSYLTRRSRSGGDTDKSQSVAWNPRDVSLRRIMQMMMFYHGSGGYSYTGLTNAYHDFIEMTPQCSMKTAVLVGRIDDRLATVKLDGENGGELYDSSLTMVRVLLPVETRNQKRNR